MSLPSINFLHLTVSEIQPGQTFSRPTRPDSMGENNTPTALKGCGVKSMNLGIIMGDIHVCSFVNGFPVCRIWFRFSRKNEIRKEYLGTGYCKHYFRLSNGGYFIETTKKNTYFVKYVTFLLYIEQKSFLRT